MAASKYRHAMKSEELYGAGQPNIAYVCWGSDADAELFATNLELLFAADVVTVDQELATDYSLPYPAGSNQEWRMAFRDELGVVQTERVYDIADATTVESFITALNCGGPSLQLLVPKNYVLSQSMNPVASAQIYVFHPSESV